MPKSAALAKAAADLRQRGSKRYSQRHTQTDRQKAHTCVSVCECACHFINKTNKQSKYIRRRIEAIAQLICCCCICARVSPRGGPRGGYPCEGYVIITPLSILPLLPTPGEPITAIFNSVSVDFLRLMPRVVISSLFCNRPVYFANRRCATLQYLFIYISNCISLSLSVCASGCVAFTFSISFSVLAIFPLASAFDHNKRKCWPRVTRPLLGLLIAHLSATHTH